MDPPEYDAEFADEGEATMLPAQIFLVNYFPLAPCSDGLTALEYSPDGNFLATGDRNGKITILRMEESKSRSSQVLENWLPHCQFQSHEPEFDFLKSLEIEGKINQIKFLQKSGPSNFLLSTNGIYS